MSKSHSAKKALTVLVLVSSLSLLAACSLPANIPSETSNAPTASSSTDKQLLRGALVDARDATENTSEYVHPGESYTVTRGSNIIAEVTVTDTEVRVQANEFERTLYYPEEGYSEQSYLQRIIQGVKLTVILEAMNP